MAKRWSDAAAPIPEQAPRASIVAREERSAVVPFVRDYLVRFGGPGVAADIGADTALPPNSVLTSVPLLFDVPADASNLVLFSRENLNQGFLIR